MVAAASLVVENCAISGGLLDPDQEADVATIGVHVDGESAAAVGPVAIVHSTIQAQHAAPVALRSAGPIVVGEGGPVTIGNDLLFTAEDSSDVVAITYTACPTEGDLSGNAFFWVPRLLTDEACEDSPRGASNIASLESMFPGPFTAQGNVYLGACEPESPTCDDLDCAGPEACLTTVFDATSLSSAFVEGFALKGDAGPPCAVAESSQNFGVTVDWGGDSRDDPPSRGADEATTCLP